MNRLFDEQKKLIARLESVSRVRPIYLFTFIGVVVLCWIFFVVRYPLLANPFYVLEEFKKGVYPRDVVPIIAIFFPVLFSVCWVLFLIDFVTGIVFLMQRRQLMEIISKLEEENKHQN
jgi:hypothetical protein